MLIVAGLYCVLWGKSTTCTDYIISLDAGDISRGSSTYIGKLRLSLGLAAVPAAIVLLCSISLPDTPNSMIERSVSEEDVKKNLQRLRGTEEVHEEYQDLRYSCANATKAANNNNKKLGIFHRKYVPQMVMTFLIPFFQQLTGINVIMFYAPVLFQTLGFGNDLVRNKADLRGLEEYRIVSQWLNDQVKKQIGILRTSTTFLAFGTFNRIMSSILRTFSLKSQIFSLVVFVQQISAEVKPHLLVRAPVDDPVADPADDPSLLEIDNRMDYTPVELLQRDFQAMQTHILRVMQNHTLTQDQLQKVQGRLNRMKQVLMERLEISFAPAPSRDVPTDDSETDDDLDD
ncbi:hypothetical protein Syun_007134 [Stephania yunnanensis]|uniref:Uncharacterized protein n=1 Tax=Stephania yunnanensis TaxID=152371 RepID=A0AAP0PYC5_9MAGN